MAADEPVSQVARRLIGHRVQPLPVVDRATSDRNPHDLRPAAAGSPKNGACFAAKGLQVHADEPTAGFGFGLQLFDSLASFL